MWISQYTLLRDPTSSLALVPLSNWFGISQSASLGPVSLLAHHLVPTPLGDSVSLLAHCPVSQEFSQQYELDYVEMFSLIAKITTVQYGRQMWRMLSCTKSWTKRSTWINQTDLRMQLDSWVGTCKVQISIFWIRLDRSWNISKIQSTMIFCTKKVKTIS